MTAAHAWVAAAGQKWEVAGVALPAWASAVGVVIAAIGVAMYMLDLPRRGMHWSSGFVRYATLLIFARACVALLAAVVPKHVNVAEDPLKMVLDVATVVLLALAFASAADVRSRDEVEAQMWPSGAAVLAGAVLAASTLAARDNARDAVSAEVAGVTKAASQVWSALVAEGTATEALQAVWHSSKALVTLVNPKAAFDVETAMAVGVHLLWFLAFAAAAHRLHAALLSSTDKVPPIAGLAGLVLLHPFYLNAFTTYAAVPALSALLPATANVNVSDFLNAAQLSGIPPVLQIGAWLLLAVAATREFA
jgi:hypothetical protein